MWRLPSKFWLRHYQSSSSVHLAGMVSVVALGAFVTRQDDKGPYLNHGPWVVRCHESQAMSSSSSSSSCGCRRKQLETFLRKTCDKEIDWDRLPVYTLAQVAEHNGTNNNNDPSSSSSSSQVWMSYGGFVYNVTEFIPLHPGGSERISRAAGAAMEPYWYLHTQHFQTDEPRQILSRLVVGRLDDKDQERIDAEVDALQEEMDSFRLECCCGNEKVMHSFSLADLQNLPQTDRISPIGCASKQEKGVPLPTSLFGGVSLADLIKKVYGKSSVASTEGYYTVSFSALDGETVCLEKVLPDNNVLIAYEENGAPLSQRRGFPLRVIIPHKNRVVKWVRRIEITHTHELCVRDD